eukprot:746166-Hanusia_phi.AAC.4
MRQMIAVSSRQPVHPPPSRPLVLRGALHSLRTSSSSSSSTTTTTSTSSLLSLFFSLLSSSAANDVDPACYLVSYIFLRELEEEETDAAPAVRLEELEEQGGGGSLSLRSGEMSIGCMLAAQQETLEHRSLHVTLLDPQAQPVEESTLVLLLSFSQSSRAQRTGTSPAAPAPPPPPPPPPPPLPPPPPPSPLEQAEPPAASPKTAWVTLAASDDYVAGALIALRSVRCLLCCFLCSSSSPEPPGWRAAATHRETSSCWRLKGQVDVRSIVSTDCLLGCSCQGGSSWRRRLLLRTSCCGGSSPSGQLSRSSTAGRSWRWCVQWSRAGGSE